MEQNTRQNFLDVSRHMSLFIGQYFVENRGEWRDLGFELVGSIDFLLGWNWNTILKKSGNVYVKNTHLKTKFHGITTNSSGIKN